MTEPPKKQKKKRKTKEISSEGKMTRSQLETTIEIAALNPDEALNPAFPVRESYIQGLQALAELTDDPEEADEFQAQFSINYIERKAREIKIRTFIDPKSRAVSGEQIAEYAKKLGEKWGAGWWLNQHPGFIDRVFRDLDVFLPWEHSTIPNIHEMRICLATARNWDIAYYDVMPLAQYEMQPGDLAFWDKLVQEKLPDSTTRFNPFLQAGIICDFASFEGMCLTNKNAGKPTVIFRLKSEAEQEPSPQ